MRSMTRSKLWLAALVLGTFVGSVAAQTTQPIQPLKLADASQKERPRKASAFKFFKPVKEDPQDDELRRLVKARYNEAVTGCTINLHLYLGGRGRLDDAFDSGRRVVQSGLELFDKPAEKVDLLTQYVEMTKQVELVVQERFEQGVADSTDRSRARYQHLNAQIQLLRAKREIDNVK